jgi:undecaprenyl-diphosphatase
MFPGKVSCLSGFGRVRGTLGAVLTANPSGLELRIFDTLNFDGGPIADGLAIALSSHALGFAAAALLLALGARSVRLAALLPAMVVAIAVSDGIGSRLLKPWFARQRPCYALDAEAVRWIGAASDVGAMPSLHAANFFALAVLGTAIDRRLAIPAFALALAVAISRVYLGVHWPADIVGGALWGAIAGALATLVLRRLDRRQTSEADGEPTRSAPAADAASVGGSTVREADGANLAPAGGAPSELGREGAPGAER